MHLLNDSVDNDSGKNANTAKRQQRAVLRAQRNALPAVARIHAATSILTHLKNHPAYEQPGYVAGYWAADGELPLHALQVQLRSNQIWCLPVVQSDGTLRFAPWRPGDALINNQFGIPEPDLSPDSLLDPQELTLAFLPLVAFTRTGQRLGMGAGYYDRSFAFRQKNVRPPPWLIGVGYAFQEIDDIQSSPWDVPMDAVVTEQKLIVR